MKKPLTLPNLLLLLSIGLILGACVLYFGVAFYYSHQPQPDLIRHTCVATNVYKNHDAIDDEYDFECTVEINGQSIKLVGGKNEYKKYDEGSVIPVYEYHGKYSLSSVDLLIPASWLIVVGLLGGAGCLCGVGSIIALRQNNKQKRA